MQLWRTKIRCALFLLIRWLVKEKSLSSPNIDKQIKDCCNGRQKTAFKYKWKYK